MIAAERVLVLSEHTRRELLDEELLLGAERIAVIPPGLNHRSHESPHRPAGLKERAGDEGEGAHEQRFLLCLGTDYHHKNRVFALRMLAALRERHGWRGTLVLAGTHVRHGSSRETEREELDAHPELREAVIELGAVGEGKRSG